MASDRLTLTVHIEPSPELREFIGRICDERIAAAVKRAQETRAAGDRKGSNTPSPAGPQPETLPDPPPARNKALDTLVCSDCGQEKIRTYFTAWGWANAICMACEKLGSRPLPVPEPDTPEWNDARLLIPGIYESISRLRARCEQAQTGAAPWATIQASQLRLATLEKLDQDAGIAINSRNHQKLHAIKEALAALTAAAE